MQYMVQIFAKTATFDADMAAYGPEDMQAMFTFMETLNKELQERGEWVEGQGLGGPSAVTTVRATDSGKPEITEGQHAVTEDFLAGYWVINVASHERAVEIAHHISTCPGPGGAPSNEPVELHAIPAGPPA
ncbi:MULTISPECIES: YciI family protein [Streptomyces]|nr:MULTISPECIES: YciI family protein [Streptomyces]